MKAQFLQWKRVTSSQHDEPTHKKPLKPMCLAIARLRPNESTALAMKESHLFPTWWANPQKTSETSVLAIVRLRRTESTTLAMKESHREVIRGNVQKQAKVANITARHWQRKTRNTQAFKPAVCHPRAARRTLRESKPLCATPGLQDAPSGNLSRCVPPPGCKTHPPGIKPGSIGPKPIQSHYATGACPKWQKMAL